MTEQETTTVKIYDEACDAIYANAPLFQHHCDQCAFLGHHREAATTQQPQFPDDGDRYVGSGYWYDLYACAATNTLVARYGDDGPDYTSGLMFVAQHPALRAAYLTAIDRGYIRVTI